MIEQWIYDKLKKDIGIQRFNHSIGVMNTSIELAKCYNYSVEKANVAGLLHDCGKLQGEINLLKMANDFDIILDNVMKVNKELIHSHLGAEIAKKVYNVGDQDILNAIRFHTTGRENMGLLEKIVYIADLIEPGRDFQGVEEIRRLAYEDIDKSLLFAMDNTLKFVIEKGNLIHLDTIKARNHLIILKNME
jgi:predicted HD superfamily hydrolase involved in NAD metabolism